MHQGYVSNHDHNHDRDYIRLDLGENLLGYSPKVNQTITSLSKTDLNRYANPSAQELRLLIAQVNHIKSENVLISESSNNLINYIARLILEPNDKALSISPSFFRFTQATLQAGGINVIHNLQPPNFDYHHSWRKLEELATQPSIKLIWLCNPNNPTGKIIHLDQIKSLLSKTKAFVVLDEAYWEYYDPNYQNSGTNLISQHKNLIVLRTLSKAYGLAGLRLGYLISHHENVSLISDYLGSLVMTSAVTQKIAQAAITDRNWLQNSQQQTKQLREKLVTTLNLNENIKVIPNSHTNVVMAKHTSKSLHQQLKNRGILTTNLNQTLGIKQQDYVRITIPNPDDLKQVITTIKSID